MGLTLVDASVAIAVLYADDAHHEAAVAAVRHESLARQTIAFSAVTWTEVLTGLRILRRDPAAVERLAGEVAMVLPVDRAAAERAALLRAEQQRRRRARLATPDAIVLGTAATHPQIDRVLTADAQWGRIRLDGVDIEIVAA